MAKCKERTFWAGYIDNRLDSGVFAGDSYNTKVMAIFTNRQSAKDVYADVRKVRIVEVKKSAAS